jgi:cell wall assembly regulator SMI1
MQTVTELSELLIQWEERWHRQGVPVQDYLAPGADPRHVRDVLIAAGFATPQEVVDWFTWHDGGLVHPDTFQAAPSPFLPLSLDNALLELQSQREVATKVATFVAGSGLGERESPEFYWDANWFPLGRGGSTVLAVEAVPDRDTCRVYAVDPWGSGDPDYRDVAAPTLTDAVRTWIDWMDRFDWTWSSEEQRWKFDFAALPMEVRVSRLI